MLRLRKYMYKMKEIMKAVHLSASHLRTYVEMMEAIMTAVQVLHLQEFLTCESTCRGWRRS